jgi:hypothetical protein
MIQMMVLWMLNQQNWPAPLAINLGEPLASDIGQHRYSAILASERVNE